MSIAHGSRSPSPTRDRSRNRSKNKSKKPTTVGGKVEVQKNKQEAYTSKSEENLASKQSLQIKIGAQDYTIGEIQKKLQEELEKEGLKSEELEQRSSFIGRMAQEGERAKRDAEAARKNLEEAQRRFNQAQAELQNYKYEDFGIYVKSLTKRYEDSQLGPKRQKAGKELESSVAKHIEGEVAEQFNVKNPKISWIFEAYNKGYVNFKSGLDPDLYPKEDVTVKIESKEIEQKDEKDNITHLVTKAINKKVKKADYHVKPDVWSDDIVGIVGGKAKNDKISQLLEICINLKIVCETHQKRAVAFFEKSTGVDSNAVKVAAAILGRENVQIGDATGWRTLSDIERSVSEGTGEAVVAADPIELDAE